MNAAEASWNLRVVSKTPPPGAVRRHHQLGSRVHRELRDSGELQRVPGLGHFEPGQADAEGRVCLPGVAERCLRLQEPALRFGRGDGWAARLREGRVHDSVSASRLRGSGCSTLSDIAKPKYIRERADCRGSHPTPCRAPERQGQRCTSGSPAAGWRFDRVVHPFLPAVEPPTHPLARNEEQVLVDGDIALRPPADKPDLQRRLGRVRNVPDWKPVVVPLNRVIPVNARSELVMPANCAGAASSRPPANSRMLPPRS